MSSTVEADLREGYTRFVFDFTGVSSVDPVDIANLASVVTQITDLGAKVAIANVAPSVEADVAAAGLDPLLPIFPTYAEAIDHVQDTNKGDDVDKLDSTA